MKKCRVCVVSFRIRGSPSSNPAGYRNRRKEQLLEVLREAREEDVTHLLLPGWTFVYSAAEVRSRQYQQDLEWLANKSRNMCVLAEVTQSASGSNKHSGFRPPAEGMGVVAIEHGNILPFRARQRFASSHDVRRPDGRYLEVAEDVFSGGRHVGLGVLDFLVLVCGENNLLFNEQHRKNRVRLRHGIQGQSLRALRAMDHHIVVNPAHTEMGNQGKLQRRWKALSQPHGGSVERFCVHVTNIVGKSKGGRAIYVFRNNKRVLVAKRAIPNDTKAWAYLSVFDCT